MIKIVGLGPGDEDAITLGTLDVLKGTGEIYLRTEKHPTVNFLKKKGISFETFDNKYEFLDNFDDVYNSIADEIILRYEEYGDIVYAVPGHPLVAEKSVSLIISRCKKNNIEYKIFPAVSFLDVMFQSLNIDPITGLKVIDALNIKDEVLDKRSNTIITQVYNKMVASEVKISLMNYYNDDMKVYFVHAAGVKGEESIRKIPLYEIDRQEDTDYLTSIFIPQCNENEENYDFNDLLKVMKKLRSENGCPWDKEQTHDTLKRYLIEECYEVLEAIDEKDDDKIVEELGDVLLQIVFHAQIGSEEGYFNINDIIKAITNKMIKRHPHVFANKKIKDSEEVLITWDKIKKEEQNITTYTGEMKHIGKNLPALMRGEKIQQKASKVGFDFNSVEDALIKIDKELIEVKDVYKGKNRARILEEIGDLLFSVVNIARLLDIQPEFALNYTIDKFIKRFDYIEQTSKFMGFSLQNMAIDQIERLWEESKDII